MNSIYFDVLPIAQYIRANPECPMTRNILACKSQDEVQKVWHSKDMRPRPKIHDVRQTAADPFTEI